MASLLLLFCIGVFVCVVLYNLIRNAINNSKLAEELEEIKELLKAMQPAQTPVPSREPLVQPVVEDVDTYPCPVCGGPVPNHSKHCPSCGLELAD
mgnify:CR=1 FL=1|jgi:ATPase involved in DNA repair